MVLVKIEVLRGPIDANLSRNVISRKHIVAKTIGGALNSHAPNPAQGSTFIVTVIDTEMEQSVWGE